MRASPELSRAVLAAAFGLLLPHCKAKPKPAPAPAVASVSASAIAGPAPAPERCRALGTGPSLTVGESGRSKGSDDDPDAGSEDEDEAMQPFATRVDSAVLFGDEFAAGGLTTHGGKTEAFVALVPLDGKPGRRVGLGAVHGDVDPPLLAARAGHVLAAVSDMDAGGGMLRVTEVEAAASKPQGELSITGVDHDVGAAVASNGQSALVVFGAKGKRGTSLRAQALEPGKVTALGAPLDLPGSGGGESPALFPRAGGYWLAWVAEQGLADAGARVEPRADGGTNEEDVRLVDAGPRVLMAQPLDLAGKPLGSPRAVSGPRSHVVGFAAAPLPDAALALTWREDDAAPGVESGPPELARVSLDGAVAHAKVEDEELSAGLPALLADPKAGGRVFMALESASEGTRVGLLAATGLGLETLIGDRELRGADLLAAGAGRLLASRTRGRAVELGVIECRLSP